MSWLQFDSSGNLKESVSPLRYTTRSLSAAASIVAGDYYIFLLTTTAAAGFTVTLPAAASNSGAQFILLDREGNANNKNVTIAVPSGEYLDDVLNGTYVINIPREQAFVVSNGTQWYLS